MLLTRDTDVKNMPLWLQQVPSKMNTKTKSTAGQQHKGNLEL